MSLEQMHLRCDCSPIHEVRYDPSSDTTLTGTVIDAIAEAADTDPIELPPLSESIDPDALERIFGDRSDEVGNSAVLGFTVDGLNVFVRGDGQVRVCDPSTATDGSALFEAANATRTD